MAIIDTRAGSERWDPQRGRFQDIVIAMEFLADAGRLMLESSTSVSEVMERMRRLLPVIGLDGCQMDANLSSLILSYWQPGQAMPLTTMRDLHVTSPRLDLLSGTSALLDRVEAGETTLEAAIEELRALERTPEQGRTVARVALLASVFGWVIFLDGIDAVTVAVALAAMMLTFPIDRLVRRVRLPAPVATFLAAVVIAAIPNLLGAAGVHLLVGPAIVGALFLFLPGRAFVSAVIDGLANAPLSSLARGIQSVLTASFLAIGMLVGSKLGLGFGLDYQPDVEATPLVLSVLGATIGVLGIAVAWGMPRQRLAATAIVSAAGWLIVALATPRATGSDWLAYAVAAGFVGVAGSAVAAVQRSSASVYTGVAILPLVPGFTLYTGMLAIAQGDTAAAASALGDAAVISVAIAIGVAIGLAISHDARAVVRRVRRPAD